MPTSNREFDLNPHPRILPMLHVEFVHCAQEQPWLPNTQCFPQSGWFSFDPSWLVLSDR
jgi:hypothetical protein